MRTPILPGLMLLAVAAALYLLPDGAMRGWRLAVQGSLARLLRPPPGESVRETPATTADPAGDLLERLGQKDAEIADLRRQLRDLGQTNEFVPKLRIVQARVIALGPAGEIDTFTVDAGLESGVRTGDAVVTGQALLGIVAKAELNASLVFSLASPSFYLSARLGPPEISETPQARDLCAVRGGGRGTAKAITFSPETGAGAGWPAFTSGLEKGVPEGLVIGEIDGPFEEGRENGTLEAPLRPKAELRAIDRVAIVRRQEN